MGKICLLLALTSLAILQVSYGASIKKPKHCQPIGETCNPEWETYSDNIITEKVKKLIEDISKKQADEKPRHCWPIGETCDPEWMPVAENLRKLCWDNIDNPLCNDWDWNNVMFPKVKKTEHKLRHCWPIGETCDENWILIAENLRQLCWENVDNPLCNDWEWDSLVLPEVKKMEEKPRHCWPIGETCDPEWMPVAENLRKLCWDNIDNPLCNDWNHVMFPKVKKIEEKPKHCWPIGETCDPEWMPVAESLRKLCWDNVNNPLCNDWEWKPEWDL